MSCCQTSGSPPSTWVSGTGVSWTLTSTSATPAGGWNATAVLRAAGGLPVSIAGVPEGEGWRFTLTPELSATLPPGVVGWQHTLKSSTEVRAASQGRSTICPNLETAASWSPLTPAEQWLKTLTSAQQSMLAEGGGRSLMTVDGMTVQFRGLDEISRALKAARQAVIDERAAGDPCLTGGAGKAQSRRILARFTTP